MNLECSVCYKKINRTYFVCGAPCTKVFHTACVEKMLEQTEAAAYAAGAEAEHKCCYCRRAINLRNYILHLFALRLILLRNSGYYDVTDALYKVKLMIGSYTGKEKPDEDMSYEIYELRDTSYFKKPKQPNLNKKNSFVRTQPRVHIKQNIGGRRRS